MPAAGLISLVTRWVSDLDRMGEKGSAKDRNDDVDVDFGDDFDEIDECAILKTQLIEYSQVSSLHGIRFIGEQGRPWYER